MSFHLVHYELSLILSDGAEYNSVATYYDGGAEPPYGGVKVPELPTDVDFTIEQATFLLKAVDDWVDRVVEIMKPATKMTRCASPDLDMETRMWMDGDNLRLKITSETLDAEFAYTPNVPDKIVMKSRAAFDLSWCGFLYYHKTLQQYLQKIKELSGG